MRAAPLTLLRLATVLALTAAAGRPAAAPTKSEEALLRTARDANAGVVLRTRAFSDLQAVATERAIPDLVPLLADPQWAHPARSVLEAIPGPAASRALLGALDRVADPTLRAGLVHSLGSRRHAEAVPALAGLLRASEPVLVAAAVNALGDIGTVPAGDALVGFDPTAATRTRWADALLRVAEAVADAEREKAVRFFKRAVEGGTPATAAAAAVRLMPFFEDPADAMVGLLNSQESATRTMAVAAVRSGAFGSALTRSVAARFSDLPADTQRQVLSALRDRGDRAAAPLARRILRESDAARRTAAAELLSVVGDVTDAPALLALMSGDDEPAAAARLALSRIGGAEVTAQLLAAFRDKAEARLAALEVLVNRGHRPFLAELLRPELHADEALARPVAQAIGTLATAADLEPVLGLHPRLPADRRAPLEAALRRIAAKHSSPDDAARLVFGSAERLPPEESEPLLVVLAGIGGERALGLLSGLRTADSAPRRTAALRALGNWRGHEAADALLASARDDPEPAVRSVAIRAAAAVFSRSAVGPGGQPQPALVAEAVAGLRKTWDLATDAADKDAILVALRGMRDQGATDAARLLEATR